MSKYVNQLPKKVQASVLKKAKKYYKKELHQGFTDEERKIVLTSRLCDLAEIL